VEKKPWQSLNRKTRIPKSARSSISRNHAATFRLKKKEKMSLPGMGMGGEREKTVKAPSASISWRGGSKKGLALGGNSLFAGWSICKKGGTRRFYSEKGIIGHFDCGRDWSQKKDEIGNLIGKGTGRHVKEIFKKKKGRSSGFHGFLTRLHKKKRREEAK